VSRQHRVIAIGAHPDDIEFHMAGTLALLAQSGYETHYFNLSTGNCGSTEYDGRATRSIRRREARKGARILGACFHGPVADDLEIFYEIRMLRRVAAVVREVKPEIVLTHSPQDYMEDHTNTCRLAVTAAFTRGMPNFRTSPPRRPSEYDVTVYHAMPHGLRDGLRRRVIPGLFVDTTSVLKLKRQALSAHRSQQNWLDESQGMSSYLQAMEEASREVGRMSRRFRYAEGWRRHLHLGFSRHERDPLKRALGSRVLENAAYERALERGH